MAIYKETINLKSHGITPTFLDITPQVKEAIANSGIQDGIVIALTAHTTCSVFFEEFVHDYVGGDGIDKDTEFLQIDLNKCLQKIVPDQMEMPPAGGYMYPGEAHFVDVESWPNAAEYLPDGDRHALLNADAHIKATMLGNSATLEVIDGKLGVGSTGYIYFVDFDRTRERPRKARVIVMGE